MGSTVVPGSMNLARYSKFASLSGNAVGEQEIPFEVALARDPGLDGTGGNWICGSKDLNEASQLIFS